MNENHGFEQLSAKRTLVQRVLSKLFPAPALPDMGDCPAEQGWAQGYLQTNHNVHLDWKDRLRVLVSGRVRSVIYQRTDVHVDRVQVQAVVWVAPPGEQP